MSRISPQRYSLWHYASWYYYTFFSRHNRVSLYWKCAVKHELVFIQKKWPWCVCFSWQIYVYGWQLRTQIRAAVIHNTEGRSSVWHDFSWHVQHQELVHGWWQGGASEVGVESGDQEGLGVNPPSVSPSSLRCHFVLCYMLHCRSAFLPTVKTACIVVWVLECCLFLNVLVHISYMFPFFLVHSADLAVVLW